MQFSITHFDNIMLPKSGKPETYVDFKSFCTKFKPCREAPTEEDKKRSAGWVRGLLKDNYRHNDNIDITQFIIIDVDKSAGVQWCKESP